jgi:hypothetical protein
MTKLNVPGTLLSKSHQKQILGGNPPGPGCESGETLYTCCIEWANSNPDSYEDMCGTSAFDAKGKVMAKYNNLTYHVECTNYA